MISKNKIPFNINKPPYKDLDDLEALMFEIQIKIYMSGCCQVIKSNFEADMLGVIVSEFENKGWFVKSYTNHNGQEYIVFGFEDWVNQHISELEMKTAEPLWSFNWIPGFLQRKWKGDDK